MYPKLLSLYALKQGDYLNFYANQLKICLKII